MTQPTFFWHDYESFGIDPARDRPAQFAGIRTDWDLNPIGEPVMIYCAPSVDYLPQPEACLITGIDPYETWAKGLCEAEFIARIEAEMKQPNTCSVGYNSIRFDDEVTRHSLFRNLRDPYAREWKNGCSRWDILDMMRLVRLMKPEILTWPERDGRISMKLEDLTAANGLSHANAHDALSDVEATIALARLVKNRAPALFDYCLSLRSKREVQDICRVGQMKPLLHISGRYPTDRHNAAVVVPLMQDPSNPNGILVWDLSCPAEILLELTPDEIKRRLYTPSSELGEGEIRPGLKTLHVNKSPVVMGVNAAVLERLGLSQQALTDNLELLRQHSVWHETLKLVMARDEREVSSDPDLSLYSGGFLSSTDRRQLEEITGMPAEALGSYAPAFQDGRLEEMLFRYRARNYPDFLNHAEKAQWIDFCRERLEDGRAGALSLEAYRQKLSQLAEGATPAHHEVLSRLAEYADDLESSLSQELLRPQRIAAQ
ncbi:exodeoxyribonuclease I [Pokkaliibacter sp. CJK22405]|uniref:exodeoxyribonuclease I n=1 Tax=Pokkaliibacter sp. CJK22405 TaxID=3384615 RepID=UPI003984C09E